MSVGKKPKIGIYIIDKRHYDFFGNVLVELERLKTPFELVINDLRQEQHAGISNEVDDELIEIAQKLHYPFQKLSDVIRASYRYDILLTTFTFKNKIRLSPPTASERFIRRMLAMCEKAFTKAQLNKLSKNLESSIKSYNKKFLELPEVAISKKIIQFPKGMDIHPDKFPDKRTIDIVDHYFCHGPYDADLVQKKTAKSTTIIGYPRYDHLVESDIDPVEKIRQEFDITNTKPLISWIPTYIPDIKKDDLNMNRWIPQVQKLSHDFEVIVRPHPKRLERDASEIIHQLTQHGFHVDTLVERDMGALYMASEFILCDYGGVVFSTIYNDRNIILLNHSGLKTNKKSHNTGVAGGDLRSKLPELYPEDATENETLILDLIQNNDLWNNQHQIRKEIRDYYFGKNPKGHGATTAAMTLDQMIKKQIPV